MIEFRHKTIRQVEVASKSPAQAARKPGIAEQPPGGWRKAYKVGRLAAGTGKLVTPEQLKLSRLKAENSRLKIEVEIKNEATAYFEKESL